MVRRPKVAEANAAYTGGLTHINLQRRAEEESMLCLMRDVAAAGNSPHAGGLPGDECARVRAHLQSDAHPHSVISQVHAQHLHIQLLKDQVLRLTSHAQAMERRSEQLFAQLEAAHDRPLSQPTPLRPAVAVPLARYPPATGSEPTLPPGVQVARSSSAGNPPRPLATAGALLSMSRSSSACNLPTLLTPGEAVPLARFAAAGNVFAAPAHSTTSSPMRRIPSARMPPSAAEGAEVAWGAQPSGACTPYLHPMQMPPTAAQIQLSSACTPYLHPMQVAPTAAPMQPFFFGAGEASWSHAVQIPGGRGIPYLMPQQQQPMAMQMQQMAHMRVNPTHFSQPLMGQPPHLQMGQQQRIMPMPPMPQMMYCGPQMPGQPLPPSGCILGVTPAVGPRNPRKREL